MELGFFARGTYSKYKSFLAAATFELGGSLVNMSLWLQLELVPAGAGYVLELELAFLVLAGNHLSHLICRGHLEEQLLALGAPEEVEAFMAAMAGYFLA